MPDSAACSKCGSTATLPARVVERDRGGDFDLRLRVDADPTAFLFTQAERCALHAVVCGECGFTEFYAEYPANLLAAWRRAQERAPLSEKER